jgi:hypothetical protein
LQQTLRESQQKVRYRDLFVVLLVSIYPFGFVYSADTIIQAVTIIDVGRGTVVPNQSIRMSDGKIVAIQLSSEMARQPSDLVFEANGLFAYPSLIDSHIHLNEPGRESIMMVASGVLFARDMGGDTDKKIALRKKGELGQLNGLRLIVTGNILDGKPPYHAWSFPCDTPEEGRKAVQSLHAKGVNQIKVYSLLKPEVYAAIASEAQALKIEIVGHIPDSSTMFDAVKNGQKTVEHLSRTETLFEQDIKQELNIERSQGLFADGLWQHYSRLSKDTRSKRWRELAKSGMVMCPTLVLLKGQARATPEVKFQEQWKRFSPSTATPWWEAQVAPQWRSYGESLQECFPRILLALKEMHEAGVPMVVGTDLANLGVTSGFSVHEEMAIWQEAGIPSVDILRSATIIPSIQFGVADASGSIEIGKRSRVVLSRLNPLEDIRNAMEIEAVVVDDRIIDRKSLDNMLGQAKRMVDANEPLDVAQAEFTLKSEDAKSDKLQFDLFYQQWANGSERAFVANSAGERSIEAIIDNAGWDTPKRAMLIRDPNGRLTKIESRTITKVAKRFGIQLIDGTWKLESSLGEDKTLADWQTEPGDLANTCWIHLADQVIRLQMNVDDTRVVRLIEWDWTEMIPQFQAARLSRVADKSAQVNGIETLLQRYELVTSAERPATFKLAMDASGRLIQGSKTIGAETTRVVLGSPQ